MANTTTFQPTQTTFATGASGSFTDVQGPAPLPTFTDATANMYLSQEVILPANGNPINPPGFLGTGLTLTYKSIQITNVDSSGYVALSFYNTTSGPVATLAPNGGTFLCTSTGAAGAVGESGTVFDNGSIQLRTCDSAGVITNGTATRVRITMTALGVSE